MEAYNTSLGDGVSRNATDNSTQRMQRNEQLVKIEITVLGICFGLAVINNMCVLLALLCRRRRRKVSRMQLFILHLSIADLIVAFFNILPQLIWDITHRFMAGDIMCRFIKYAQMYSLYLSTYVLIMTAIDRYRAICHPFSSQTWTPCMVYCMIFVAYAISAVFSIPQAILFQYQEIEEGTGVYDCWVHFEPAWVLKAYALYIFCALYLIPLIILIFTYGSICYKIWSKYRSSTESIKPRKTYGQEVQYSAKNNKIKTNLHSRGRRKSSGALLRSHSARGFSRAKLKTVKLTFMVILAYVVCWSPFFVSHIWWLYDETAIVKNDGLVVILLLASLNSCTNPWIYLAFNNSILRNLIPCKKPKMERNQSRNVTEMRHLNMSHRDAVNSLKTGLTSLSDSSSSPTRKSNQSPDSIQPDVVDSHQSSNNKRNL